jgi:hypothetical protein
LGWFSKLTSLLHGHTYLFISSWQPLRVVAVHGTSKVLSPQWLNLPKRSKYPLEGKTRGSGTAGFAFHRFPWGDCDNH